MVVIATAGHVDHGKSTLVRALTGIEPDRWDEERRRGVTIDLGYAWTTLSPPHADSAPIPVSFVDVPGHRRFIGNMLAGLGPAPAVLVVVAADEGWREQSAEHLAAIDALGLRHGLLAVTRTDLADEAQVARTVAAAQEHIARTSLGRHGAPEAIAVSARTGAGLEDLRAALTRLIDALPAPDPDARVRLWADRAFTITGAGTVVTGTLGAGRLRVGDRLELGGRIVTVRGLQSQEAPREEVTPTERVAVNLRGVAADEVGRGQALCTPGAWWSTESVDILTGPGLDASLSAPAPDDSYPITGATHPAAGAGMAEPPATLQVHLGTAVRTARVRRLDGPAWRLTFDGALPLVAGDRLILRDPGRSGSDGAVIGAVVLDVDPPPLTRRGDARRRAAELLARAAEAARGPQLATEVARRGAVTSGTLRRLGVGLPDDADESSAPAADGVLRCGEWWVAHETWKRWRTELVDAVAAYAAAHPMKPWMPIEAARQVVDLPATELLGPVATAAGLEVREGTVHAPGVAADLGVAEPGLQALEARLTAHPFDAPERPDLDDWRLGTKELAAAAKAGRILRLADDVVLLPSGPAQAMRRLAALPQPFTTSQARQALQTTRRVAIPLLEHLDGRGWTRRIDGSTREVVR